MATAEKITPLSHLALSDVAEVITQSVLRAVEIRQSEPLGRIPIIRCGGRLEMFVDFLNNEPVAGGVQGAAGPQRLAK